MFIVFDFHTFWFIYHVEFLGKILVKVNSGVLG